MGKSLSEGWKIFIAGVLFTLIITHVLPYTKNTLWSEHPKTYIYFYGMENSHPIKQGKISLVPIRFPKGVSPAPDSEIPIKFFNWTYSKEEKLYTIVAHNKGDGVARDIKIDIDFTPNSIKFIKISNENRVKTIQGGKVTGTSVVFEIDELLPTERQDVEILIKGKNITSFDAWSETEGPIDNVYILDILFL